MMLQNLSLRHIIPLLFLSGSLLVVLIFYSVSLPNAERQIEEISKTETRNLVSTLQSRLVDHLMNKRADLIRKEIYFISTDYTVKRVLVVDSDKMVRFANRSRYIDIPLSEIGQEVASIQLPLGESSTQFFQGRGADSTLLSVSALRFQQNGKNHEYSLGVLRDYTPLADSIVSTASTPAELLASLMLLMSIGMIILLRSHLEKRLSPLIKAASELAKGNTGARAELRGSDEFAEIGRAFDTMAQKVELTHSELNKAREYAEKANAAKNQFVGLMSHEIQTPLAGLTGFIDLLQETELDQEGKIYVRSASAAARTLGGLVSDLFETSQLENGNFTLSSEPFCLNTLLQEIIDSMLPKLVQKGLSIKVIASESNPIWIKSDPRVFRQILASFLSNAAQFTKEGRITVTLMSAMSAPSMTGLSISVADTGFGVSKKDIGHLFERFYKSSDPRIQAAQGAGLGLAISKELSELIGGNIRVESELGKGSTFTLELEVEHANEQDAIDFNFFSSKDQKPQHILLIEHSVLIRSLLENILVKWGHTVTLCETTEKALEVARHPLIYPDGKPFDLILLDLHMPPPGSFSLIEDIKGMDAQNAKLPVIGMTTQADFSVKEKCRKAGISGFVMKPVDRKKLADEIFRLTRLS